MSDQTPRLVSDDHALMAVGALSAELYDASHRQPTGDGRVVTLPEPPEWLGLWDRAVDKTIDDATKDLREKIGAREPTAAEQVEVDRIARAHYDSYCELNRAALADPIPFDDLPKDRKALMRATIADMLMQGTIRVGSAAAEPEGARTLYVRFANRPGPGIKARVEGTLTRLADAPLFKDVAGAMRALAEDTTEFIEVENEAGASVGPAQGIGWVQDGESWLLGPFPADARQTAANRAELDDDAEGS